MIRALVRSILAASLLAGAAHGAVNPVPDQSAFEWTFSSTATLTVDSSMSSGDSWSQPTSGDIILMGVSVKDAGATNSVSWPAGFTEICDEMESNYGHGLAWKVATGSGEGSLTATLGTANSAWIAYAVEIPSTDLDTSALDGSSCNINNSSNTSQTSGTVSASAADGVAVALFGFRRSNAWDGRSYTNSFTERDYDVSANSIAGRAVASKAITASGNQTTTITTTDIGDPSSGMLVLFTVSASAGSFSDPSPRPGDSTTYTCGATFASTITTLTSPDGDVINADGGAGTCTATFTIPAQTEFSSTGSMNNTQWDVDGTWTVTGGGTETPTLQIDPPSSGEFGDLACTAASNCPGNTLFTGVAAANDDYYALFSTGSGSVNTYGAWESDSASGSVDVKVYDESGNVWLATGTEDFAPPAAEGGQCDSRPRPPLVSAVPRSTVKTVPGPSVCESN